jgi:transcriptional regulator with XRE-family HTH domain
MNNRISLVRKELRLNQTAFAKRLGVTPTTISRIECGKRGLTDQMILSICREFKINEEWLRSGVGKAFIESNDALLNELALKFRLDCIEIKILSTYLKLPTSLRTAVTEFFVRIAQAIESGEVKSTVEYFTSNPITLLTPVSPHYNNNEDQELTEEET